MSEMNESRDAPDAFPITVIETIDHCDWYNCNTKGEPDEILHVRDETLDPSQQYIHYRVYQ